MNLFQSDGVFDEDVEVASWNHDGIVTGSVIARGSVTLGGGSGSAGASLSGSGWRAQAVSAGKASSSGAQIGNFLIGMIGPFGECPEAAFGSDFLGFGLGASGSFRSWCNACCLP